MSEKSKTRVLVCNPDKAGVGYYRLTNPHILLNKNHGDDFHVTINPSVNWEDKDYLGGFDIVVFHRMIQHKGHVVTEQIVEMLRKMGIKTVVDIDDYYILPKEHPMYGLMLSTNIKDQVANSLKVADYVTTTTPYFRDVIAQRHNKNVVIFENGIDPNEKQFKPVETESERLRIGFIGGSSHMHDLGFMQKRKKKKHKNQFGNVQIRETSTSLFRSLRLNHEDDIQIYLCGYDIRGNITDQSTGKSRAIRPKESVWYQYEQMFTDNYELIDDEGYKNYLGKFTQEPYVGEMDQPYVRRWTKGIKSYATHYNDIDVSLAPLVHNEFNRCKSQLKVIEAGFFKKALVAEKIEPYLIDIVDGKNGFLVNSTTSPKEWYQKVRRLIRDRSLVEDMGEALYETVKDKYDLNNIVQRRAEFYKSII